ncbi:MAG: energy-coupling factor transporter ATPase [Clostridia bacterium]|nr:energy-coupling factor transporter ATPase [Clostridia bacterium]
MSIRIENLSYVYMKGTPYEKIALNNINININKGEFVGIIGHTGSGKTTLVQHLNGLLKPSAGKISIDGRDVTGENIKELRKQVGIVFQYPEHQLFEETVYKDVAYGLLKQGLPEEEASRRVIASVRAVGLNEEILAKSPFELSGGQKRRVAIAGVLAMEPEIIVLDEPAAGLDPKGRSDILGFISKLHKESGLTIILVSHNMEDIVKLAERVVVMNKGSVAIEGKPKDVFCNTQLLEEIGLSAPQVTYFMHKLKDVLPSVNTNILTVDEAKTEILKALGVCK